MSCYLKNDHTGDEGARKDRLQKLIKMQEWTHLSSEQRERLSEAVVFHENLFMLNDREIGTISGESGHIFVTDGRPK